MKNDDSNSYTTYFGLSPRAEIASRCLQGLLSNHAMTDDGARGHVYMGRIRVAVEYADALIAELEKEQEG